MICDHTALAKVNESNIFSIFRDFILLSEARALNLDQPVDKKEAFLPVFLRMHDDCQKEAGGKFE